MTTAAARGAEVFVRPARDYYEEALAREARWRSLPPAGRQALLNASLAFAERTAGELRARHGSADPAAALESAVAGSGVAVIEASVPANFPLLAEYHADRAAIELYPERIAASEAALRGVNPRFFERASLRAMCLAHEFLHHRECLIHKRIGGAAGFRRGLPGRLGVTLTLAAAGEVAAHEFVRLWFGLDYTPLVLSDIVRSLAGGKGG